MKIGDRVKIILKSCDLTSFWDTPFGVTYLYTFKDMNDNTFIWKSQKFLEDDIYVVKGRIKDIMYYNNKKEFVLTYCRPCY